MLDFLLLLDLRESFARSLGYSYFTDSPLGGDRFMVCLRQKCWMA